MSSNREALMCYIRRLASLPLAVDVSDAALLGRFLSGRDEQAFTALVKRHGAMVHQVCGRILGNGPQAEDAFQATFLVLARKANAVRPREALPAWLHGVARRVSLKARAARSRLRETVSLPEAPADRRADPLAEISARELLTIIDEEVQRLPEQYRLPVILCCLGDRSLQEAARQLGWTVGSVKGRLERGRTRLHDRLVRRGLTLSVLLAAVEFSRATTSAASLAGLIARSIPGALAFGAGQGTATGVSTTAAALASRVGMAMALPRLVLMAVLLTTAALGASLAFRGNSPQQGARAQDSSPRADLAATQIPIQEPAGAFWDQSDIPLDVRGQVLDPHGKPLAGAELYVGYSVRPVVRRSMPEKGFPGQVQSGSYPRRATTGADGRFHFRFATSELDPSVLDDARPAVIAIAAGFGAEWVEIGPSTTGDLKLQLVDDFPASGRVLDWQQRPVAGARLVVQGIYSAPGDELTRFLKRDVRGWGPRVWKGPLPGSAPVIFTDADGRWGCTGLGRDRIVAFALEGPQVIRTMLNVATRPGLIPSNSSKFSPLQGPGSDFQAPPVHTVRGTVRDRITGNPLAGIRVAIRPGSGTTRSGPDGRFELLGYARLTGHGLEAQPESDQGYFVCQSCAMAQADTTESTLDLLLTRGITLSGRVTNIGTGKPPKTARVEYYPLSTNGNNQVSCANLVPASTAMVRPDGSYSMVVLPGPGLLGVVASPREDYAQADIMNKEWSDFLKQQRALFPRFDSLGLSPFVAIALGAGQPGPLQIYKYHALALINPPQTTLSEEKDLPLRTTQTIQGTIVGPDGQPLSGVQVAGLTALRDESELLESASFTVTGLNAQGSRELFFQHRDKKVGKVVTVRGNETEPLTVKLEPCGAIHGRLVDESGIPMPGAYVVLSENSSPSFAMTQTDQLGKFRMDLVPGQKYSWANQLRLAKDIGKIQVAPSQVLDVGDLVHKRQIPPPKTVQPPPGGPH